MNPIDYAKKGNWYKFPEITKDVGPQSYHQDDYSIFYNNIKENVAKRIAAYKAK